MTLKTKLIGAVVAISIIIIGICSLFTYISIHQFSENVDNLTEGLSKDVKSDVSGFANHYAGTMIYLEGKNVVERLDRVISSVESSISSAKTFSLQTNPKDTLENFVKNNSYITSMFIIDNNNTTTLYPENNNTTNNYTTQAWYKDTIKLKPNSFNISEPTQSFNQKEKVIRITTPLNRNGQVSGVIGADIKVELLSDFISTIKVGDTGSVILVNKNGKILGHKDSNFVKQDKTIKDLPIFMDEKDGKYLLDINKVSYTPINHELTGWVIYSLIPKEEILSFTDNISINMKNQINNANKKTSQALSKLISIQVFVIIGLIIASFFISYMIARYFINPLKNVSSFMETVANGDLSNKLKVKQKDEIGILLISVNKMIDSFRDMILKINSLVKEVEQSSGVLNEQAKITSNISNVISDTMGDVYKGSEQLTTNIFTISDNIEKNVSSIHKMTENISSIASHARETKGISSEGQKAMEKMNNNMQNIVKQSHESTTIMKSLDYHLQQISAITHLILEISEQTNLLSLNAAIEAARAGEQGKGFAVVANEVKKLAEESSKSVEKVTSLISQIQTDSKKAFENIDNGRIAIEEGAQIVIDSKEHFQHIVHFIDELSESIDHIATASDELSKNSNEVFGSIEKVTSISQTTTAGVQEVSGTTDEQNQAVNQVRQISDTLKTLTSELKNSIDHFRI